MEGSLNTKQLILPIMLSISLLGCGGGGSSDDQPNPDPNTAVSDGGEEASDTDDPVKSGEADSDSNQDIDGGTDSDGDSQTEDEANEENNNQGLNRIMSSIWMGNTCSDYGDGTYFKSLFQFGDEGKLLLGIQSFEDSSCNSRSDVYSDEPGISEYFQVSYVVRDQSTLPDGTEGYAISLDYTEVSPPEPEFPDWPDEFEDECNIDDLDGLLDIDEIEDIIDDCTPDDWVDVGQDDDEDEDVTDEDVTDEDVTDEDEADEDEADEDEVSEDDEDSVDYAQSVEAYFSFPDEETLCFSNNILLDTEVIDLDQGDGSSIDYEHCLTFHSAAGDQPPSPQPDPEPDTDPVNSQLQNHHWLADDICYTAEGEDGSYMRVVEFTRDNRVVNTELVFTTADCSMEGELIDSNTQDDGGYNDLGEEMLSDGVIGNRIEMSNLNSNTEESLIGFYLIDQTGQLCLSYNLGINNVSNSSSTDIDYEHCLVSIESL